MYYCNLVTQDNEMIIKIVINKQCIDKLTIRSSDGKRELSHKKAIQYILHIDKHY